jgi:cold shock CspA family protein
VTYLFDDRAIDAHIKKLQGVKTPSSPRRERRAPSKEYLPMHSATVSRWHTHRGFGFLLDDADVPGCQDREIFCHAKNLPRGVTELIPGSRVEFVTVDSKVPGKQPQARVTRILDLAPEAA